MVHKNTPPSADAPGRSATARRPRIRWRRIRFLLLLLLVPLEIWFVAVKAREYLRVTPTYDPPVLAGQMVPGHCSAGFHARLGDRIVLTMSAHCGEVGDVVTAPDGTRFGTIGPRAGLEPCPYPDRGCRASDLMYVTLEPDHVPWGHLNEIDFGAGGYHVLPADAVPLRCADVSAGQSVALNGLYRYREGTVLEKGPNDFPEDVYFPCIVVTSIEPQIGDSGGSVLVDGRPAGITSRMFGKHLAFTPLAEGLEELGLELCTTPDCGLVPPAEAPASP